MSSSTDYNYSTFEKCCEDDLVMAMLLKHMRHGISYHDYRGIVSSEKIAIDGKYKQVYLRRKLM